VYLQCRIGLALLLAVCGLAPNGSVRAQPGCEIEEAQRLFGQQPRPTAKVEQLLSACAAAGSTDYRVYMFLGVMARDAGDSDRAIESLRKAHQLDPAAPNPALELAFTLEAKNGSEAAQVYGEVLARDPGNRPALLGQARVARGQYRLDEARAIYERLLAVNAKDAEALNGLAWLALANRNRERGRQGFERVLALDPNNEEAKAGLSKTEGVYRYLFDVDGAFVSTAGGNSWGAGARALAGVTPFDTVEIAEAHFTNELQTLSAVGIATLPSDDVRIGWHRLVPLSYGASLVYDYRAHTGLPTEHWIDGSVVLYLTDDIRWFGGYREAFGAFQWNSRLIRTGLSASLSPSWEVSATAYDAAQALFNNYQDIWSWVFDVTYHGPRNMLVVAGAGYSPTIDNVDLHVRTILPVTDRIAIQLVAAHNSINADTRVTAGLRFTW